MAKRITKTHDQEFKSQAVKLTQEIGGHKAAEVLGVPVPSERAVYRVMEETGMGHRPKRKPNGVTKADKEARKSDDLMKRNFKADKPLQKCVTDMTEIKCLDGKLYVSAVLRY